MTQEPRCPECGYTALDAGRLGDHHLCRGEIPKARGSLGRRMFDAFTEAGQPFGPFDWEDASPTIQAAWERAGILFAARLSCSETEQMARDAFERLSSAANTILAHVTAQVGRALYEAPDEDLVPLMATYGVKLPAKLFRILYDAADPAILMTPQTPASVEFAGNGTANRTGADDTPGIPPNPTPSVDPGA